MDQQYVKDDNREENCMHNGHRILLNTLKTSLDERVDLAFSRLVILLDWDCAWQFQLSMSMSRLSMSVSMSVSMTK